MTLSLLPPSASRLSNALVQVTESKRRFLEFLVEILDDLLAVPGLFPAVGRPLRDLLARLNKLFLGREASSCHPLQGCPGGGPDEKASGSGAKELLRRRPHLNCLLRGKEGLGGDGMLAAPLTCQRGSCNSCSFSCCCCRRPGDAIAVAVKVLARLLSLVG